MADVRDVVDEVEIGPLPWQVAYFPAGTDFTSQVAGKDPLNWTSKYAFVGMAISTEIPQPGVEIDWCTFVIVRGVNDSGLALSHQAYGHTGETPASSDTAAMLEATQLGLWLLSNVDHSSATFGTASYTQPDSGIASSALPSSNASVGRFIRAVY